MVRYSQLLPKGAKAGAKLVILIKISHVVSHSKRLNGEIAITITKMNRSSTFCTQEPVFIKEEIQSFPNHYMILHLHIHTRQLLNGESKTTISGLCQVDD